MNTEGQRDGGELLLQEKGLFGFLSVSFWNAEASAGNSTAAWIVDIIDQAG